MSGLGWFEDIGRMRERLTLKSPVAATAVTGETTFTYSTVKELFCFHRDVRGRETFTRDQEIAQAEAVFQIRYQECTPGADWILVYNGKTYELVAPPVELGTQDGWELYAKVKRDGQAA